MTDARQQLGLEGEDMACRELEKRGHVVIDRRYRTPYGELDIITKHAGFTVFVEVRAKSNVNFGEPSESVTTNKQRRMVSMATEYCTRYNLHNSPCRFDVVAIEMAFHPPKITVFEDAFRPGW